MLLTTIVNTPMMECESPFILACDGRIHGDNMKIKFIGDFARARQHDIKSLRTGDVASIGGKIRRDTILVESFTLITNNGPVGRNLNMWA